MYVQVSVLMNTLTLLNIKPNVSGEEMPNAEYYEQSANAPSFA